MFIGIDTGSISTKTVIIDRDGKALFTEYLLNRGNPIEALKTMLERVKEGGWGDYYTLCTTGSGRRMTGRILAADVIKNEITATWMAMRSLHTDVRTIIEIGGQDSKLITLGGDGTLDFRLNSVCAAGTGSFLEQQARRLNIPIDHFAEMTAPYAQRAKFTGRCTVFVETEMINLQQKGYTIPQIVAGLMEAVCENYLNDLTPGMVLKSPIYFCGGVSQILPVRETFNRILKQPIHIPPFNRVMAAYGAALLARQAYYGHRDTYTAMRPLPHVKNSMPVNTTTCGNTDCLSCGRCYEHYKD